MNDKDIRPYLRKWIDENLGRQLEEEITVSSFRLDMAVLSDFITGFEIKGDSDPIMCPHLHEQVEGYSRACRHSYLVITDKRFTGQVRALATIPWHWGLLVLQTSKVYGEPSMLLVRVSSDSSDLSIPHILDGLHKRELSALVKPGAPVKRWAAKPDLVAYLATQIPVRRAEALLAKSLRSSNFRVRNIRRKIAKREEVAA